MMSTSSDILLELQRRWQHACVHNAKRGTGSFLTLDLLDAHRPDLGQLHVWIQYCQWSVFHNGRETLGSATSHADDYAGILAQLDGRSLDRLSSSEDAGLRRFTLGLSDGYELRCVADLGAYDRHDDLVVLFDEGGETFAINQALGVYVEPAER